MGRIHVLSDKVANQIAAGEVVERPASVLKELLENSLDAGATDLRVDVESGGRRLIRVADNGVGMIQDDALLAFERHATSKLSDAKDLLSISTLGFRGEALPSIASVSRVMLETRNRESSTGTLVEVAGSKILRCDEIAMNPGTTVAVRDLFFNVPARKKFLRSDQTELAHIASLVTHYSLAFPDKSFVLRHANQELLQVSPVSQLRDRVYQVFGGQIVEDLIDLGARERQLRLPPQAPDEEPIRSDFRLRGFVSQPQVQKLNSKSIYLFVNGRFIRDKLLLHALTAAYHNLMPPASYPFALVFLECDPAEVDVNVHPAKTEVRFRHASFVHDFVRDAVRDVLMISKPAARLPLESPQGQKAAELPFSEFTQQLRDFELASAAAPPISDIPAAVIPPLVATPPAVLPEFTVYPSSPRPSFRSEPAPEPPSALEMPGIEPAPRLRVPETHTRLPKGVSLEATADLSQLGDLHPLGQLHDSFIIAAGRDGLWIIDQHVAHERILFEQVLKQRSAGKVEQQNLLMPLVMELTPSQQLQFDRISEELTAVGFAVEPFGPRTIAIQAAPAAVGPADIERVVSETLDIAEKEFRKASVDDLRRGIAASLACRAAIKINTPLEQTKMQWLLNALSETSYPMACPHGRPIALRYTTRDILKSFHRI